MALSNHVMKRWIVSGWLIVLSGLIYAQTYTIYNSANDPSASSEYLLVVSCSAPVNSGEILYQNPATNQIYSSQTSVSVRVQITNYTYYSGSSVDGPANAMQITIGTTPHIVDSSGDYTQAMDCTSPISISIAQGIYDLVVSASQTHGIRDTERLSIGSDFRSRQEIFPRHEVRTEMLDARE